MTEQQKRRIEDRKPTEKLDWEDPDVKASKEHTRLANAMAVAGAALLAHTGTAAALAAIPNTDQYVVAGTLAMIAKVLPAEPIPPLTAPAPLTDDQALRDLMPKRTGFIKWCKARGIDTGVEKDAWGAQIFKHAHVQSLWTGWFNAPTELPAEAAPAPQQSELTDEEIEKVMADWSRSSNSRRELCRAIEAEVANKAAPAAPVQTAEPSYWNSQRKMIERAIVGLRDGWATRKDADDALAIIGSGWAVQAEQAQAEPAGVREFVQAVAHNFDVYSEDDGERSCRGCSALIVLDGIKDVTKHRPDCIVPRAKAWLTAPALPAQAEQAAAVRAEVLDDVAHTLSMCRGYVENRLDEGTRERNPIIIEAANSVLERIDEGIAALAKEAAIEAPSQAALDVLAERRRQVEEEGWHPDQDDDYEDGQLSMAAACYAMQGNTPNYGPPPDWPWDRDWWKPTDDRRNLVKAGALIIADIERIDRAAAQITTPSNDTSAQGDTGGDRG